MEQRARLALYVGDCDTAFAISRSLLPSAPTASSAAGAPTEITRVAKACAGAVAGSSIVEDRERGLWLRLQDDEDRALAPLIMAVAGRARDAIEADLAARLPRPLRIELVRDLFSLAAITGLPVEAAETTGTLGVARWGRITLLSPRATSHGYQWQDTLAHEIAHLVITRASRDRAPLWLQEGLAKREERRWRKPRPGDGEPAPDRVAHAALLTGQSVGIAGLGPSIAMLPTPQAATIAFAEVSSFVAFFVERMGAGALRLLLRDLAGLASEPEVGRVDSALRSVSGYDLLQWNLLWQHHLLESADGQPADQPADLSVPPALPQRESPMLDGAPGWPI